MGRAEEPKDLKPVSGRLRAQFQRVAAGLGSSLRAEEIGEGGLDTGKTSVICCLFAERDQELELPDVSGPLGKGARLLTACPGGPPPANPSPEND